MLLVLSLAGAQVIVEGCGLSLLCVERVVDIFKVRGREVGLLQTRQTLESWRSFGLGLVKRVFDG